MAEALRLRAFPPHARGWTCIIQPAQLTPEVSPARAGMDPLLDVNLRLLHSRFPARAGMDRLLTEDFSQFAGFPRTRGDGPSPGCESEIATALPPHARGWTRYILRPAGVPTVSPARAGMDPRTEEPARPFASFPRTRGDGPTPWHSAGRLSSGIVSPARAGMDPGRLLASTPFVARVSPARAGMDRCFLFHARIPRVVSPARAGMDTAVHHHAAPQITFPPHARGWTATTEGE